MTQPDTNTLAELAESALQRPTAHGVLILQREAKELAEGVLALVARCEEAEDQNAKDALTHVVIVEGLKHRAKQAEQDAERAERQLKAQCQCEVCRFHRASIAQKSRALAAGPDTPEDA